MKNQLFKQISEIRYDEIQNYRNGENAEIKSRKISMNQMQLILHSNKKMSDMPLRKIVMG